MTTLAPATADQLTLADELLAELPALPQVEQTTTRQHVICLCAPWARREAARYRGTGESMDDLSQVAMVGLILAVDRFDPSRRVPFRHFALPTISGELKKHFRDKGWSMHVSRRVQELYQEVRTAEPEVAQTLGRTPTDRDLAEHLHLPDADVRAARQGELAFRARSLNRPTFGDGEAGELLDTVGGPDSSIESIADRDALRRSIALLPERLRTILAMRFVDEFTQCQIADKMGISQMHVSRLIARSLRLLRDHMEADTPTLMGVA